MSDEWRTDRAATERETVMPDLAELCRIHEVSLELIQKSHDVDELLDGVLEEYERRLREMSADTLAGDGEPVSRDEAKKLQALVMFAGHAVALKEKAAAATQLRQRAEELERLNSELERTLAQEELTRRRLDDVLAALDAGVMVVGSDGTIRNANRAAAKLTGVPAGELVGREAQPFLGQVERGADGEVDEQARGESQQVVLVARRDLLGEPGAEVVLLSDVTAHARQMEERNRVVRFAELMRTLSALSHKINNPLTSLMGRAQILRMKKASDADVQKAAEVIEESSRRIAEYIRELALVVQEGKEEALQPLLEVDCADSPSPPKRRRFNVSGSAGIGKTRRRPG